MYFANEKKFIDEAIDIIMKALAGRGIFLLGANIDKNIRNATLEVGKLYHKMETEEENQDL
jgi:hypothetical protein